ncbi:MAG: hypothetical protein ABEI13_01590, partial [Candidatus Paceibacteria bacterium]
MIKHKQIEATIRHYISIPLTLICVAVFIYFSRINYRFILAPIIGGVLGSITSIFFFHFKVVTINKKKYYELNWRIPVTAAALYISSLIIMYRLTLYQRPIVHYAVFGIYAGLVAYECVVAKRYSRVLPQIGVLIFFTYWSGQLAFPNGIF